MVLWMIIALKIFIVLKSHGDEVVSQLAVIGMCRIAANIASVVGLRCHV